MDLRAKHPIPGLGRPDLPAPYAALDAAIDGVPSPFNQRFYLNVDHWDGAVAWTAAAHGQLGLPGGV